MAHSGDAMSTNGCRALCFVIPSPMWLQSPLALDAELSREEADGGPLGSTNSSEACQASHSPRQQPERIAYSIIACIADANSRPRPCRSTRACRSAAGVLLRSIESSCSNIG